MNIKKLRNKLGYTQREFAERYNIPFRTIQNWEAGIRKPPVYINKLIEERVLLDLENHKTNSIPKHDSHKKDLPKRKDYVGSLSWLEAVMNCLGDSTVFALDEALMCQELFGGRNDEYIVYAYGDNSLLDYNGVVLLGNNVSDNNIEVINNIKYTNINRTLYDSLINESILDMQGITEAISKYYFKNKESFKGLFIPPNYQKEFDKLASDAVDYYNN